MCRLSRTESAATNRTELHSLLTASGISGVRDGLRQAVTPDRLLGRVMSSYRLVGRGAGSPGGVLGGALAAGFGLRAPSLACASGMLVVIVLSFPALCPGVVAQARETAVEG